MTCDGIDRMPAASRSFPPCKHSMPTFGGDDMRRRTFLEHEPRSRARCGGFAPAGRGSRPPLRAATAGATSESPLPFDLASWTATRASRRPVRPHRLRRARQRATRRSSCTGSRSTASSGAARSSGCRRTAAAWRRTFSASVTPNRSRDRASAPTRRSRCSSRCSTTLDSGGATSSPATAAAPIAQLLVARHPERVRTLLLTNCDRRDRLPAAGPAARCIEMSRSGAFVDSWLAPWLADKQLARSAEGIGGMCYVDPAHPTDEAIECYFSPLVHSPRRKAQTHAYAVALDHNCVGGCGTGPARLEGADADRVGDGRHDLLAREPGLSGSRLRRLARPAPPRRQETLLAGGTPGRDRRGSPKAVGDRLAGRR